MTSLDRYLQQQQRQQMSQKQDPSTIVDCVAVCSNEYSRTEQSGLDLAALVQENASSKSGF